MKIVISSGHGKLVAGASSIIDEVTEARKVVPQVASYLKSVGVDAIEYHENTATNKTANLNAIVKYHNSQTRDLDVSVHFNAFSKTDRPMGVEVLYYSEAALAAKVSKAIADASRLGNRGAKERKDLYFLNGTAKPAILIEVCFVDSSADVKLYQEKFDEICKAIAEAISGKAVVSGTQASAFTGLSNAGAAEKALEIVKPSISSGLFPSVKGAQMLLESGYVKSELALNANNCFGMKTSLSGNGWPGSAWDGVSKYTKKTQEQNPDGTAHTVTADFRRYSCIEDSVKDHSAYLLGAKNGSVLRYAGIAQCKDYREQLTLIKTGGYATDVQYVEKLCSVIEQHKLDRYDADLTERITLVIGGDVLDVPVVNIGEYWCVTMPDGVKVRIRDILDTLGYGVTWEASSRTIVAVKK